MSLTLSIVNIERLDNGEDTRKVLDRRGALIGRSPHADWSLPDPNNYISGIHCEIAYRDGAYVLTDRSTNGTFLNGQTARMAGDHVIAEGDEIAIGHYRISASLAGVVAEPTPQPPPPLTPSPTPAWPSAPTLKADPWDAIGPGPSPMVAAPPGQAAASGWSTPPASSGWGSAPMPAPAAPSPSDPPSVPGWSSPPAASDAWAPQGSALPPAASAWRPEPAGAWGPPDAAANSWNTPGAEISGRGTLSQNWAPPQVAATPAAGGADVWARVAESHGVDWAREGFSSQSWAEPQALAEPPRPATDAAAVPSSPAASPDEGAWQTLLSAAGLTSADLKSSPRAAAAAAGGLMRAMAAGMILMLEARARAKAELRATGTTLGFEGNNPLKFARTPEQALARLLSPPEPRFMAADKAVEDAFKDLQAHQIATLSAMQSALRATLDRFSPASIRERFKPRGLFAGSRNAQLWAAYERDFEGVAQGSDEAFMDVFATQFREAYERAASDMKRR